MDRRLVESRGKLSWPCWIAAQKCADCCCGKIGYRDGRDQEDGGEDDEVEDDKVVQYTLRSRRRVSSDTARKLARL